MCVVMTDTEPKDEEGNVEAEAAPAELEAAPEEDVEEEEGEEDLDEEEEGEPSQEIPEKPLDDDLDRRNPQYIPKGGAFYEHDNRTQVQDGEAEEPTETDKKKKVWKESKSAERWMHDCYIENDQSPKSTQEIVDSYGYDIRKEEAAPRARRRRKYGRGPDKYDRKWDDEEAYIATKKVGRGRGQRRSGEQFPPLPNSEPVKPSAGRGSGPNTAWRSAPQEHKPSGHSSRPPSSQGPQHSNAASRSRMEDHIKPFRTDSGLRKPQDNKSTSGAPLPKEVQELSQSLSKMNVQQKQKPRESQRKDYGPDNVNNKQQHADNPANRQNPKRYSKIRKGFSGYYSTEEIELDPRDVKQAIELRQQQQQSSQILSNSHLTQQQQQELIAQGVLLRFPDNYNGNPGYLQARPITQPMAQAGLSPQGLPTQALSPQLPAMAGIEMGQANFVPPPMYIDIEPHYGAQEGVLPFQGYPTFPQGQNAELYQPPSGITYYSPEVQTGSAQSRALLQRRPKAIPIVPPPEAQ